MTIQAQEFKNPSSLFDPAPYGFSHMVTVPEGYKFIFIAGQGGEENTEGKLSPDFRRQVAFSLKNIKEALTTEALTMDSIIKVTTLVVDHDAEKLKVITEEFNKVWPAKNFPINTLIPVPKLAIEGMLVEIEALAVKKPDHQ
ncbi:RidA family protein [Chryseobacterium sp. NRRL B-14859]|uniref:RidA family protein n=1 Tax=Chryseobacterium sp. NRRL B-14859 TaxID=1562763 RepID=UPI0033978381